jgi:hypothetical protein
MPERHLALCTAFLEPTTCSLPTMKQPNMSEALWRQALSFMNGFQSCFKFKLVQINYRQTGS